MQLSTHAVGSAPVETAWQRYVRPAAWSGWSPQISRVDCTDEVIRPGSTGTVHGPLGIRVDFEVLTVDHDAHTWSWRVDGPLGVRLSLRHSVSAAGARTRTDLGVDGAAPVVLGYLPLATLALTRLVRP